MDITSINTESNLIDTITNALNDAIEHGYIICLISEHYLSSTFAQYELSFALEKNSSRVIKIYLPNSPLLEEKIKENYSFNYMLKDTASIDATKFSSMKDIVKRIAQIDLDLHTNI